MLRQSNLEEYFHSVCRVHVCAWMVYYERAVYVAHIGMRAKSVNLGPIWTHVLTFLSLAFFIGSVNGLRHFLLFEVDEYPAITGNCTR